MIDNRPALEQNPALKQEATKLMFDIRNAMMLMPQPPLLEPQQIR